MDGIEGYSTTPPCHSRGGGNPFRSHSRARFSLPRNRPLSLLLHHTKSDTTQCRNSDRPGSLKRSQFRSKTASKWVRIWVRSKSTSFVFNNMVASNLIFSHFFVRPPYNPHFGPSWRCSTPSNDNQFCQIPFPTTNLSSLLTSGSFGLYPLLPESRSKAHPAAAQRTTDTSSAS